MNSACCDVLAIKGSNRNQESVLKTEVVEIKDSVKANMPTLKSAFCSEPTITDMKRLGKFIAQRKRPRTFLVTFSNAWDARSLLAKAHLLKDLDEAVFFSKALSTQCNGNLWYSDFATWTSSENLSKILIRCVTWHWACDCSFRCFRLFPCKMGTEQEREDRERRSPCA